MRLFINLASERFYAYYIENDEVKRVKNGRRDYFDSFVCCNVNGMDPKFTMPSKSFYHENSLLFAMYYLCSDSGNSLYQKTKSIHPIPVISSTEGQLEYVVKDVSISPKSVLSFIIMEIIEAVPRKDDIDSLSVIIPDFFDQQRRCALKKIFEDYIQRPVIIRFINASTASISVQNGLLRNQEKAMVIRYDSGVFEVSIFKDDTPVISLSDDSIGGVDIVTTSHDTYFRRLSAKKRLDPTSREQWLKNNWLNIYYYVYKEDNDDNIVEFKYSENGYKKDEDFNKEDLFSKECIDVYKPKIIQTIRTCLQLAGYQPSDISCVISTGMWSSQLPMRTIVNELFSNARFIEKEDDSLCKNLCRVKEGFKQCLQTAWVVEYKNQSCMALDRFVSYPCHFEKPFNFVIGEDDNERDLFLNMISMNDNTKTSVNHHNITHDSYPGEQKTVIVSIDVDENGIVSDRIYSDMNKRHPI